MRSFYKWNLVIIGILMVIGVAHDARASDPGPSDLIVSRKPSNEIIAIRRYTDWDYCRADRQFIIYIAERLGQEVWVTCTPLGME